MGLRCQCAILASENEQVACQIKRFRPLRPMLSENICMTHTKMQNFDIYFQMDALPDDCLRMVFERVSDKDLGSLSQCCRRFHGMANDILDRRFEKKFEQLEYEKGTSKFIRRFGKFVCILNLYEHVCNADELKDISDYCPSVTSIWINDHRVMDGIHTSFSDEFLQQLVDICINFDSSSEGYDHDVITTMQKCINVQSVRYYQGTPREFFQVTFPKLEKFDFGVLTDDPDIITAIDFNIFCQKNPTIKKLQIDGFDEMFSFGIALLNKLEHLELFISGSTDLDVLRRISLKYLKLSGFALEQHQIDSINKSNVEHLELKVYFNRNISKITVPMHVQIYEGIHWPSKSNANFHDLIDIVKKTPNLLQFSAPQFEIKRNINSTIGRLKTACENLDIELECLPRYETHRAFVKIKAENVVDLIRDWFLTPKN